MPNVSHYYDEPYKHSFTKVIIVGGGNSAIEAALELYRHDVDVTMVVRGEELKASAKYWLVPDIRNRIKEGKIKVLYQSELTAINDESAEVRNASGVTHMAADFIYILTGYLPDKELLLASGLSPDEKILVKHDPKSFETDIEGLYLCGTVLAGVHTEKVFIESGRDHAIAIANDIVKKKSQVEVGL